MADEVPGWIQGPQVDRFLSKLGFEEQAQLYRTIASLLLDPGVDGINKFSLDYFPFAGENLRQCRDSLFLIIYRAQPSGTIYVHQVFRVSELPDLGRKPT